VVLEKDGEDRLDRSCEIRRRVTKSQEERNIIHTLRTWKGNLIAHILRRNCLQKHDTVGKIEGRICVTGR
jgi:hypothetical protein